jgi:hypothetical protein
VALLCNNVQLPTLLDGVCRDDRVAPASIFMMEASPPIALLRHGSLMGLCEGHGDLYCAERWAAGMPVMPSA